MQRQYIEINLGQHDLNGSGSIIHDDYMVHYDHGDIAVFFTKDGQDYDISFGDFKNDDGKITIHGASNNVIISNSRLSIHELKVDASHLVIEEDCEMKSQVALLSFGQAENYGLIKSSAIACDVFGTQSGFTNFGSLDVSGQYEQSRGSLINTGSLHANDLLVQNGKNIENKPDADWQVDAGMQVIAESLVANGDMRINQLITQAGLIALEKKISGKLLVLAADRLHVYEDADINYNKVNLAARETLIIEGSMQRCDAIKAIAKDVHVTETAVLTNNEELTLAAVDTLECHNGAKIIDIDKVMVGGNTVYLDCDVSANQSLDINSERYAELASGACASAAEIRLLGNDHKIYGSLSGNLSTPEPIHHLYLGNESLVDQCRHLAVNAMFIDADGEVEAVLSEMEAGASLDLGKTSNMMGESQKFSGSHVHLAGHLDAEEVTATALNHIDCDPDLDVYADRMLTASELVALDGKLFSGVSVDANVVLNNADISNISQVDFTGHATIVNTQSSAIRSEHVTQTSKTIVDQGVIVSELMEETAQDLRQDNSAVQQHGDAKFQAERGVLAGQVTARRTISAETSESLLFLAPNNISSDDARLLSSREVRGPLHLTTRDGLIGTKDSASLTGGEVASNHSLTMTSRNLRLASTVNAAELKLVKPAELRATLELDKRSVVTAAALAENYDKAIVAGKVSVGTAMLQSADMVKVTQDAVVNFDVSVSAKTEKFNYDGKLTVSPQKTPDKKYGMFVEAAEAKFSGTAEISAPIIVSADKVRYSGTFAGSMHTQAVETTFTEECRVTPAAGDLTVTGKTNYAKLTIEPGALIQNRQTLIDNINLLNVSGTFASKLLLAKLKEIKVAAAGRLGSKSSDLNIDAEDFYLYGMLEANTAIVKCSRMFFQNRLFGEARIKVNSIDLTTPLYLNLLGVTEARQASFTSFISACLGFEFVYSKTDNSFVKMKLLPTIAHLGYLESAIRDIMEGRVDLLDAKYILFGIQAALQLLEPVLPAIVYKSANTAVNAFCMYQNLMQVYELIKTIDIENARMVDLLPLLVAIKNSVSTGVMLADNIGALATGKDHPLFDLIEDAAKYVKNDLWDDIKDLFGISKKEEEKKDNKAGSDNKKKQPPKKNENPKKKDDKKKGEKKKDEKKDDGKNSKKNKPKKKDPTFFENLKEKFQKLTAYDVAHATVSEIFAVLSLIGPSVQEDSVININILAPKLTGNINERGAVNVSVLSPSVAMTKNVKGLAVFQVKSNDRVYSENIDGYYVDLESDLTHNHNLNLSARHLHQAKGTKVRPDNMVLALPEMDVYDIKGERSTTFKYSTVVNGHDEAFEKLDGEFKGYRPDDPAHATINYVNETKDFDFNKSYTVPWGVTYTGKSINIGKGVRIESKGDTVGFRSTDGDISNYGAVRSNDTVFFDSAGNIYEFHGGTLSKNLYMHAHGDIDLIESGNYCRKGAIVSDRGNIVVLGGVVYALRFLYLGAHGDITGDCKETDTIRHGAPDKKYQPGRIWGGDGYGYHGVGLYAHSDNVVRNRGSIFGARGDYVIVGDHGIEAIAPHNPYVVERSHKNYIITSHDKTVYSERIQRPQFKSTQGDGYLLSKRGTIISLAGDYRAHRTFFHTRYAPELQDLKVRTVTIDKRGIVGIPVYDKLHIEDKCVGQIFVSPEALGFECHYGNIVIPNSRIETDYLRTRARRGKVIIYQTPIEVYDRTTYLTLGINVGPFNYSHSFNPEDPNRNRFFVQDPLLNSSDDLQETRSVAGTGSAIINATDAAVGKGVALASGDYGSVIGTSCGVKAGYTTTEMWSQELDPNCCVRVGFWEDKSAGGIELYGMPTSIGRLKMDGHHFKAVGLDLNYHGTSSSTFVGVNGDLLTDNVSADLSHTHSTFSGRIAVPIQVNIGEADFDVNLEGENANIVIGKLNGRIRRADITSHLDVTSSSVTSASVSTNGGMSFSHSRVNEVAVNHQSSLQIDDMTNGRVDEANLVGAKLLGDGLMEKPPTITNVTPMAGKRHEAGYGFSMSLNGKGAPVVNSVSYANATTVTSTDHKAKHSGVKFRLNAPMQTLGFFARNTQNTVAVPDDNVMEDLQSSEQAYEYDDEANDLQHAAVHSEPAFRSENAGASSNDNETLVSNNTDEVDVAGPSEQTDKSKEGYEPRFTSPGEIENLFEEGNEDKHRGKTDAGKYGEEPHVRSNYSATKTVMRGAAGAVATGLGYGLTGLSFMQDAEDLSEAWDRSDESYEPVLHEAAKIGGRTAGAAYAVKLVSGGLNLAKRNPLTGLAITVGADLVGGDVGEYLVDMSIFSAKTIGSTIKQVYFDPPSVDAPPAPERKYGIGMGY